MKRVALVVGINRYPYYQHLAKAAEEADRVANLLRDRGDFEVYRLPNVDGKQQVDPKGRVKKEELGEAILQLFAPQGAAIPETALFYFAGHGGQKQENGQSEGFLQASDFCPEEDDWGISLQWLRNLLEVSKVRQQIVWLDCCHSGELFNFAETDLATFFEKQQDRCFIAASREFEEATGGVLTPALLEGLNPDNSSDGWVNNVSLGKFLEEALKNAPQHPIIRNPGGKILLTGKGGVRGNVCPYKGLAYFDEADSQYFYGRTKLTEDLIEKVCSSPFLAVSGVSGSGKSSVVRAGLLQQLRQGAIPGQWTIYPPFTPGEHPLKSLKQVVGVEARQLEAVVKAAAADRVVLVVDQFEEVFALCREERERQAFFEILLGAVERLQGKLCLVVAIRADFLGKCAEKTYAGLTKAIDGNLVTVLPMNEDELREAIANPAQQVGVEIDRELVKQIIDDVLGSPGDLPLMQYTLTQLWDKKTLNRLMLIDYTRLGGVRKALENHAKAVYNSLSEQEKKIAKGIFLELTRLGEGTEHTRRQVRRQDLIHSPQLREVVERVVQKLANAKLVVTGEETIEEQRVAVVNIAHEALIRNWGLLGQWLKENRVALSQKQEIEDAAREWRDRGRGDDYLLQGKRLERAEEFQKKYSGSVSLSGLAQAFLSSSYEKQKRTKKKRLLQICGIVVGGLSLSIFGIWQWQSATINESRELINASFQLIESNQIFDALINSLKAEKKLRSVILEKSDLDERVVDQLQLLSYYTQGQAIEPISPQQPYSFLDGKIAISPDMENIALTSSNAISTVYVFDFLGKKILDFETGQNWINKLHFSPEGKYILTTGSQEESKLFKLSKSNISEVYKEAAPFNSVDFSSNGKIATINQAGYLNVWDFNESLVTSFYANSNTKVSFDSRNQYVLTSSDSSFSDRSRQPLSYLWDLSGNNLLNFEGGSANFSPDRKYVVSISNLFGSSSPEMSVKLWKISGEQIANFEHQGTITDAVFSPNSQMLITFAAEREAKLWSISGSLITTLRSQAKWFSNIFFSFDSQNIVTIDVDNRIQLWNLSGQEIAELGNGCVTSDRNHEYFVACNESNVTRIWSSSGEIIKDLIPGSIKYAAFNQGGDQLAVLGSDGAIRLWNWQKQQKPLFRNNAEYGNILGPNQKYVGSFLNERTFQIHNLFGTQVKIFDRTESRICKFSFDPNSEQLVTGENNGNITLWNLSSPKPVRVISKIPEGSCNVFDPADRRSSLGFNPNGLQVAAIDYEKFALRDLKGNKILEYFLDAHPGFGVRREFHWNFQFNTKGNRLITYGGSNKAQLWDPETGLLTKEFQAENKEGFLTLASFSSDDKYLLLQEMSLSGDSNITTRIYDASSLEQVYQIRGEIYSVAFSEDSQYFLFSDKNILNVVNLDTWNTKQVKYKSNVVNIAFSSKKNKIAVVEQNNMEAVKTVSLYDLNSEKIKIIDSAKYNTELLFSHDGNILMTYSGTSVQLWNAESGKNIVDIPVSHPQSVTFSFDDKQIITTDSEGNLRFWMIKSRDEIIRDICKKIGDYLKKSEDVKKSDRNVCD